MKAFLRALSWLLLLSTLGMLAAGCSPAPAAGTQNDTTANPDTTAAPDTTASPDTTAAPNTTAAPDTTAAPEPVIEPLSLDGKKVIVIGNSYVYNGDCVIRKSNSVTSQASRSNDRGLFYHLCLANGDEVSVTNWTYGGHSLGQIFDGECTYSSCPNQGRIHENDLTDRVFDYVIVSPGGGSADKNIEADFNYIIDFFRAANPDVKFVCMGNLGAHGFSSSGKDLPGVYNYYKTLEEKGVIIADWGGIVWRLMKGIDTIPGSAFAYTTNTFIVKDGYHPNMLAGYITALTAYCAITGAPAVGQPYAFCNDVDNIHTYASANYSIPSNFPDIFASESEMKGIQQLVDRYLAEKPYHTPLDKNARITTDSVMLDKNPEEGLVSVVFSAEAQTANGWRKTSSKWEKSSQPGYAYFSGIRGDIDAISSLEGRDGARLTAAMAADIADIRYGLSMIGLAGIDLGKFDITSTSGNNDVQSNSVMNLLNGHFGSSWPCKVTFDTKTYNIRGEEDASSPYTALITLNFGEKKTFSAIGYASGDLKDIPQAQDVYVSDDGVNWTLVPTAGYDAEV
ncbi:MAG: hypothetical protein IKL84_01385, partial [Clostridia bacterium]|nr:hypothetical protein [Clostridia bacterium]